MTEGETAPTAQIYLSAEPKIYLAAAPAANLPQTFSVFFSAKFAFFYNILYLLPSVFTTSISTEKNLKKFEKNS